MEDRQRTSTTCCHWCQRNQNPHLLSAVRHQGPHLLSAVRHQGRPLLLPPKWSQRVRPQCPRWSPRRVRLDESCCQKIRHPGPGPGRAKVTTCLQARAIARPVPRQRLLHLRKLNVCSAAWTERAGLLLAIGRRFRPEARPLGYNAVARIIQPTGVVPRPQPEPSLHFISPYRMDGTARVVRHSAGRKSATPEEALQQTLAPHLQVFATSDAAPRQRDICPRGRRAVLQLYGRLLLRLPCAGSSVGCSKKHC